MIRLILKPINIEKGLQLLDEYGFTYKYVEEINHIFAKGYNSIGWNLLSEYFDIVEDEVLPPAFIPNDTNYSNQWQLSMLRLQEAWDITLGDSVSIAVCDTGFTTSIDEFQGQLILPGWCVVTNSTTITATDGHGNGILGVIIPKINNKNKTTGVAPNIKVFPIRITTDPSGNAYVTDSILGLLYACNQGYKIISTSHMMSTYFYLYDETLRYLQEHDVLVTNSAGNDGLAIVEAHRKNVLSCGTIGSDYLFRYNYGIGLDLVAPSYNAYWLNYAGTPGTISGTSFSSPIVSGICALVKSIRQDLGWQDITEILRLSANQTAGSGWTTGFEIHKGYGLVDAKAALDLAKNWKKIGLRKPILQILNTYDNKVIPDIDYQLEFKAIKTDYDITIAVKVNNVIISHSSLSGVTDGYKVVFTPEETNLVEISVKDSYEIETKQSLTINCLKTKTTNEINSYTFTENQKNYKIRIRASNESGVGNWTDWTTLSGYVNTILLPPVISEIKYDFINGICTVRTNPVLAAAYIQYNLNDTIWTTTGLVAEFAIVLSSVTQNIKFRSVSAFDGIVFSPVSQISILPNNQVISEFDYIFKTDTTIVDNVVYGAFNNINVVELSSNIISNCNIDTILDQIVLNKITGVSQNSSNSICSFSNLTFNKQTVNISSDTNVLTMFDNTIVNKPNAAVGTLTQANFSNCILGRLPNSVSINNSISLSFDNLALNKQTSVVNLTVNTGFTNINLTENNIQLSQNSITNTALQDLQLNSFSAVTGNNTIIQSGFDTLLLNSLNIITIGTANVIANIDTISLNNNNIDIYANANINTSFNNVTLNKPEEILNISADSITSFKSILNNKPICNLNLSINSLFDSINLSNLSGIFETDGDISVNCAFEHITFNEINIVSSINVMPSFEQALLSKITVLSNTANRIARPYQDVEKGTWLSNIGNNLFDAVDDIITDDSDYIFTDNPSICRMKFTEIADTGKNITVSYRASSISNSNLEARLYQDNILIATFQETSVPSTKTTFRHTLSDLQNALITDRKALYIELEAK